MRRESFGARFINPAGGLFLFLAVSFVLYGSAGRLGPPAVQDALAFVAGLFLFFGLGFGVFYVYPRACRRGAGPGERVVAALINPALWAAKEAYIVSGVYSPAEALYFLVNPMNQLVFFSALAQIGLCEFLCQRRKRKMGEPVRGRLLAPATALVVGLGWVISLFAWDLGVHHFYIFQEGYKYLFGYGL